MNLNLPDTQSRGYQHSQAREHFHHQKGLLWALPDLWQALAHFCPFIFIFFCKWSCKIYNFKKNLRQSYDVAEVGLKLILLSASYTCDCWCWVTIQLCLTSSM